MGPFAEFDNVAEQSKYPFSDDSSMKSESGYVLPCNFFLDLSICLRSSGVPYLSGLENGTGTISVDGAPAAYFNYSGPGSVDVFDAVTSKRCGCVVLGKAATGFENLTFGRRAARLCPACFCTFYGGKPIVSVSDGTIRLSGNVRITGKNGVYVTLHNNNELRIDVIGNPVVAHSCSSPVQRVVIISCDCPVVAGATLEYSYGGGVVPGVILLHSLLSADDACGKKESFIQPDGTIGERMCTVEKEEKDPDCIEDTEPAIVYPSNGNIDFVPFSGTGEQNSPVNVKTEKLGIGAAQSVASMSDPSMKNLAALAVSGTVVFELKGKH